MQDLGASVGYFLFHLLPKLAPCLFFLLESSEDIPDQTVSMITLSFPVELSIIYYFLSNETGICKLTMFQNNFPQIECYLDYSWQ